MKNSGNKNERIDLKSCKQEMHISLISKLLEKINSNNKTKWRERFINYVQTEQIFPGTKVESEKVIQIMVIGIINIIKNRR